GVLAYLEMLETQAHQEAVEQEKREQQKEKLAMLKARVRKLRLQRDKLREKVDLQEKQQPGKEGVVPDPAHPIAPRDVVEWRIRNLQALLQLFYLTGISGKPTRRGVCFSLSTAYEGTYLDSYHLELCTNPQVQILRHSIPVFIPLEQISKKYLQTDIRRFLSLLSDHLNAYAGRRHQAEQLEEHFSDQIEGALQRNSLYNLLIFNYNIPRNAQTFPFQARLLYGDPCCSLPTEVTVSCTPDAPASLVETAASHSEMFRCVALHKAFQS
ncbi:Centromere protein O, partial [Acanthisitta chloris]